MDDDATDGEEGPSVADELLPPLHRLLQPATKVEQAQKAEGESESAEDKEAKAGQEPFTSGTLTIVAHLDKKFPLTEAKWVRSGKPDEWIESISGPAAISGNATPKGQPAVTRSAWIGKIKVIDPEAVRLFHLFAPRRKVKGCRAKCLRLMLSSSVPPGCPPLLSPACACFPFPCLNHSLLRLPLLGWCSRIGYPQPMRVSALTKPAIASSQRISRISITCLRFSSALFAA